MDQRELNELKVDLAIIKKDIKQIEKFFDKVDTVVDEMSEIAKAIAVQQQLLANFDSKLSYTDQRLLEAKKESLEGRLVLKEQLEEFKQDFAEDMQDRVSNAHKDHAALANEVKLWNEKRHTQMLAQIKDMSDTIEIRVRQLEITKWYAMGVIGVIGLIASGVGLNIVNIG